LSSLRSAFLDRYLFAAVACAAFAVVLAYQVRLPFKLAVGGPIDGPLLSSVHDPEVEKTSGTHFRWTTGSSELILRDWGAGNPALLRVRVSRWQPDGGIADLAIYVNGLELAKPQASGQGWQEYALPVTENKFLRSDDLRIKFESDTFIPKTDVPGSQDARRLGIQINSIALIPLQHKNGAWRPAAGLVWSPVKLPPLDLALYFVGFALAVYLSLSAFTFPRPAAWLATVGVSALAAGLLILARPYVTLFAGNFFLILLASICLAFLARYLMPRWFVLGGVHAEASEVNTLAVMLAFAFLFKLAFLLYPQTVSFDLLYHLHRLQGVLEGRLHWLNQSTQDVFGGQQVPYQPGFYVFLSPLGQLARESEDYLKMLIRLAGVLFDCVPIAILYFWLKKYLGDGRAGLFAGWIYMAAPLGLIALSMGLYTNLFGQFTTLLLLVGLLEALGRISSPRAFVVLTLLFTLAMLAHAGVFVSLVILLGIWFAMLYSRPASWRTAPFWRLVGCIAIASVIAFALYYSDFASMLASGDLRVSALSAADTSAAASAAAPPVTFWQLLQPARTRFTGIDSYIYLSALLGIFGLALVARRIRSRGITLFVTLLGAYGVSFLVSLALRATLGFSPRYVNFTLPAIAVCAGVTWAWIYGRGRAGRLAAVGISLVLLVQDAYQWYILAMYQYH
jgi:hypothetical protein